MIFRLALLLIAVTAAHAADSRVDIVKRKLDLIESNHAKPGSVIVFTLDEVNAFVKFKAAEITKEGLRQPRIELGNGGATGYALIDFLKMRHGAGVETNWLVSKIIQGEKPVKALIRVQSGNGRATVNLQRVEIGGLGVTGTTLDFLIHTFVLPLYPEVKIDQQFELAGRIDRIEIVPAAVRVYIKK